MATYVKMTPAQWSKPNSQTNEPRLDILRKIIKNGDKIPLNTGAEVVINNTNDNLAAVDNLEKTLKPVKLVSNRGEISSSQIGKSAAFGGAQSGAGGGTKNTALAEGLQAIWIHAMLGKRIQPFESYSQSDLKTAYGKAEVNMLSLDEMLGMDASWHWSAYWSAKLLMNKGYLKTGMTIHRGDDVMKAIYKLKDNAFKNSGIVKLGDDKWNPGDIWAIGARVNISSELSDESIQKLNSDLVGAFDDRKIVGISLKKIVSEAGAKLKEENRTEEVDDHIFTRASLMASFAKKGESFFRSKMGLVIFDTTSKMDVRASAAFASPNMEITLKTARGGRASWAQVTQSAKKRMNYTMPTNAELTRMAKDLKNRGAKSSYANNFYLMAKTVHPTLRDKNQFLLDMSTQTAIQLHSKLAATHVCSMLEKNKNNGKSSAFVSDLVNFAGSKTAESSIYVKVYE